MRVEAVTDFVLALNIIVGDDTEGLELLAAMRSE